MLLAAIGHAPPAAATSPFDSTRSFAWLEKQVAFGPRVPGTVPHAKCRDAIAEEMKLYCDDVELRPFKHTWSRNGKAVEMFNIVGTQNWKSATKRVVLLAHWDTRPSAEEETDPANRLKPIPGANDGASGVAVLLELMRHTRAATPKELGVMYLMVDGEDLGPGLDEMFLGAVAFSKAPGDPKPDYGILLDMIGDKDLKVPMEPNSYYRARSVTTALYTYARTAGLGKTFPMQLGPEILDDHLSLNDAGIPTVDLIDFDYPSWHTLADTPDKCSPASLGKVGDLLFGFLSQPKPFAPK